MHSRRIDAESIAFFRKNLLQNEKSAATIEKYLRDINQFRSFSQGADIDKELVLKYKAQLMENCAPASTNSKLAALNCFFREMGWHDCVVKSLKMQRSNFRDSNKVLSREEYFRLLDAARRMGKARLYLLIETICSTGIRVSELRFITVEAARRGKALVSLKGKTRYVLLPSALSEELLSYAQRQSIESGSIFVTRGGQNIDRSNVLHEMKTLCKVANVEKSKVYPHNLRHLFACSYYDARQDLSHLADILGHSSLNTTRIYTCTSEDEHQKQIDQLELVRPLVQHR